MIKYGEINTIARAFLSSIDIQNKWIFGDCKHVLNVSKRDLEIQTRAMISAKGATYEWFPLEENEKLNIDSLIIVMLRLLSYKGEETIVHCLLGNNRSRLVCEFATYAETGEWPEYKDEVGLEGCKNRTFYNIKKGFLPEIGIVESMIRNTYNTQRNRAVFQ